MDLSQYDSDTLAAALRIALGIRAAVDEGDEEQAICGLWDDLEHEEVNGHGLSWRDLTAIRDGLYLSWPKYSGCSTYPVPASPELIAQWGEYDGEVGSDETFEEVTAKFAYDESENMWQGEYGKLRRELLDYIIDSLAAAQ